MEEQSKSVAIFNFEDGDKKYEVRTVVINGEIWFVAADVGKALEIKNIRQVVAEIDDDEKGVCNVYTLGGFQEMLCVNQSGLQELIWKSRKPNAKKFKNWIKRDVIPAIATTGVYDPQGQIAALQQEILQLQSRPQLLLPEHVTDQQAVEVLQQVEDLVKKEELAVKMDEVKRYHLEFALEKARLYLEGKGRRIQSFNLKDKPDKYGMVRIKEYPDETKEEREFRWNQEDIIREEKKRGK